jgi:ribosomal protein S18
MKVCGFTFIRNAIKFDYPVKESILSILSICDKFVVAVGNSEDSTLDLIRSIDPEKIEIVETVWDDSHREGGRVLAVETDKAFQAIGSEFDWCFYIQGDEVIHEKYLPEINRSMLEHLDNNRVDGLLFKYLHFYGSFDYVGESYRWYRNEIRIVRNNKSIFSFRDAQGFRKEDNKMLKVKPIDAYVYHYGWVKDPGAMQKKQEEFNKLWHNDEWIDKNVLKADEFDYSDIDVLKRFEGMHPKIMHERIEHINWQFDYDLSLNKMKIKDKFKKFLENFGFSFGQYKNYKLVK